MCVGRDVMPGMRGEPQQRLDATFPRSAAFFSKRWSIARARWHC
jgi:hypothetical protein